MKRHHLKYHSFLAPQARCPLLTSKARRRSWLMLLAQYQAAVYFCLSMIFLSFLTMKAQGSVLLAGRGHQRKRCLCVVHRGLWGFALPTCAVCRPFVTDASSHHHKKKSARKSVENGIIVLIHSSLSAFVESGRVFDSASGLLVALVKRQFAGARAKCPTTFQAQ